MSSDQHMSDSGIPYGGADLVYAGKRSVVEEPALEHSITIIATYYQSDI